MILEFLLSIIATFVAYGYYWLYERSTFWKKHNVPHIPSKPGFGHFDGALLLRENMQQAMNKLYNHPNAKKQPFVGINIFHKPAILLRDPELIKKILIKDFNSFSDRYAGADPMHDPLGGNVLFEIKNPTWRLLRSKLSPVFTSGKMKQMFYMVEKTAEELREKLLEEKGKVFEAREVFSCFTIDVISLVAFGTEANCLKSPETSEFLHTAESSIMDKRWGKICFNSMFLLPELFKFFRMTTFSRQFGDFLTRLFTEVTAKRIETKATRNDLIDALIALKNVETDSSLLTQDVLVAQAAQFFVAGFETSSSTLSFVFHKLAEHPDVQEKLRQEIRGVLLQNDGKFTYENIMNDFPYLSAIINETLRFFPILPFLDRECVVTEYNIEPFSNFRVPYKMPVLVPSSSLHMDPEYFPNPEKFDPERFVGTTVNEYTFMPFGVGPHNCIGERFAWMQIKMGIIKIMMSFTVEFADKSSSKMTLDETCLLLRPKNPINLKFVSSELVPAA